jgi:hypothetical protein
METSKAAMKAALRVLTALSERQEPDQTDVDELHWYAPSDRPRPLDELVCDAIQRALRDREEKRKAIKVQLRERSLALSSAGPDGSAAAGRNSIEPHDREVGRLVREHHQRRREYLALNDKLKRLGAVLQQATEKILAAGAAESTDDSAAAKDLLQSVAGEIDLSGITELLNQHARLAQRLVADEQVLKDRGIQ